MLLVNLAYRNFKLKTVKSKERSGLSPITCMDVKLPVSSGSGNTLIHLIVQYIFKMTSFTSHIYVYIYTVYALRYCNLLPFIFDLKAWQPVCPCIFTYWLTFFFFSVISPFFSICDRYELWGSEVNTGAIHFPDTGQHVLNNRAITERTTIPYVIFLSGQIVCLMAECVIHTTAQSKNTSLK